MSKYPLLGMTLVELQSLAKRLGMPGFAAKQIASWLYDKKVASIDEMTNLSLKYRELLKQNYEVGAEAPVDEMRSVDGTVKYLYKVGENHFVESVYIPDDDRATLCVSSQVGCKMNCKFCMTGKQGYKANLTASQIINQIHSLPERDKLTNVVMMGMGEPLANYDNVITALSIMLDDHGYGLSRRRVTVSTSGMVPQMDRLKEDMPVALAVSLHASNDAVRDEIVPLNKKYPLTELMAACRRYGVKAPRDFVTFEYVMLDGINDKPEHARELLQLVQDVPCKFNLIPFNPFPNSGYARSSAENIRIFRDILQQAGLVVTVRKTRGEDIDAACGQLAGQVRDKTRRQAKWLQLSVEKG